MGYKHWTAEENHILAQETAYSIANNQSPMEFIASLNRRGLNRANRAIYSYIHEVPSLRDLCQRNPDWSRRLHRFVTLKPEGLEAPISNVTSGNNPQVDDLRKRAAYYQLGVELNEISPAEAFSRLTASIQR